MSGTGDLQQASRGAQIGVVVLFALIAAATLFAGEYSDRVGDWLAEDPAALPEKIELFMLGISVLSVPLLAVGIMYIYYGSSAVDSERFPPNGMQVIKDTPITRGADARSSGRRMQVGGVLLSVIAIGFPVTLYVILRRLVEMA